MAPLPSSLQLSYKRRQVECVGKLWPEMQRPDVEKPLVLIHNRKGNREFLGINETAAMIRQSLNDTAQVSIVATQGGSLQS